MPGGWSIVMCTVAVGVESRTGVGGIPPTGGLEGRGGGDGEDCLPSSYPWRGRSPEDTRKVAEYAEYGSDGGRVQEQYGCSGADGCGPPHVSYESAPGLRRVGRARARTSSVTTRGSCTCF